ncbi:GlxA family transcriptional regulator [Microbulbifer sp. OS29]|uniref:GlxA family transcriptional regulator n=1 Tax=Microbulbifer okhotskensis TaxID=2926617 RepID=A0A9X2END2_9GAMM|nr:GlxA family transcriptional regulator [Microbulbifer okhotskensis]MCO1334901.1 GlxA family transcriptional regulator [Microbulbifer okhotskensis]
MNKHEMQGNGARKIAMLVCPGATSLDVTGPLEVFALANHQLRAEGRLSNDFYEIQLVGLKEGPVVTSSGIKLYVDHSFEEVENIHTLLVSGMSAQACAVTCANSGVLEWLAEQQTKVTRIGSICSGALILANAGVLDGRRATTHWAEVSKLQEFAKVQVDPDAIYIRDDNVYTSAGITAGIDLALAMIEEDHGRGLALNLARILVLYLKRDGGQQQFSVRLENQINSDRFAGLVEWMYQNVHLPITVERLAQEAAMSPRNFARSFVRELGVTPARFLEQIRVDKACQMFSEQNQPQEKVAKLCGFQSQEQMRRAFRKHKGILPSEYRKRFH